MPVGEIGATGQLSREQTLGELCNQVAVIYAEGRLVAADPAKACHYFARACEFGNADACANLAAEYIQTTPAAAETDARRAFAKLEQDASGATNARVSFMVGYSYDTGRGNSVDKAKARHFYERAAALGDASASKYLGRMQAMGEGGPRDTASAAIWLQKAVDAQDGPSCMYLARLYHLGDGVPQDEKRANALLEKACSLGVQGACDLLQRSKQQGSL
jgi:hypothetical protein